MALETLKNLVTPDQHNLDKEWTDQPRLYLTYAVKLANAKKEVKEFKASFDVMKATMKNDILENPQKLNIKKPTVDAINSYMSENRSMIEHQRELNKLTHSVNMLEAMVEAIQQKKTALESLVYLHGQSYFAKPKMKNKTVETVEAVEQSLIKKRGRFRARKRGD